jgi:hypothetical protein
VHELEDQEPVSMGNQEPVSLKETGSYFGGERKPKGGNREQGGKKQKTRNKKEQGIGKSVLKEQGLAKPVFWGLRERYGLDKFLIQYTISTMIQ